MTRGAGISARKDQHRKGGGQEGEKERDFASRTPYHYHTCRGMVHWMAIVKMGTALSTVSTCRELQGWCFHNATICCPNCMYCQQPAPQLWPGSMPGGLQL